MNEDFTRASNLLRKRRGAWQLRAGYKKQGPPTPEMCKAIRQLVNEAVYSVWNREQKPANLRRIFCIVQDRIKELHSMGQWQWGIPGKRTIDRRVSNCADSRFYDTGIPKIVAVSDGIYRPNPELVAE